MNEFRRISRLNFFIWTKNLCLGIKLTNAQFYYVYIEIYTCCVVYIILACYTSCFQCPAERLVFQLERFICVMSL